MHRILVITLICIGFEIQDSWAMVPIIPYPSGPVQNPNPMTSSMWVQPPFCQLGPSYGNCLAYVPSFTYNATEGRCVPYVYGGCGKTENLFPTELECSKTCDKDFNGGTPSVVDCQDGKQCRFDSEDCGEWGFCRHTFGLMMNHNGFCQCMNKPPPNITTGPLMSEWSNWKMCEKTCYKCRGLVGGKGCRNKYKQYRERTCRYSAVNSGQACPSILNSWEKYEEERQCDLPKCAWPIWSEWSSSECSVTCGGGGVLTRKRKCIDMHNPAKELILHLCKATFGKKDFFDIEPCAQWTTLPQCTGVFPPIPTTPKPDSPSMKIEMCLLSKKYGRRQIAAPSINVILVDCKPSEVCVESGSSILGNELGICTAKPDPMPKKCSRFSPCKYDGFNQNPWMNHPDCGESDYGTSVCNPDGMCSCNVIVEPVLVENEEQIIS